MPKPSTPLIRWSEENQNYELSTKGRPHQCFASEDGPDWISFLETHTSFSFRGREGQLSVIKEIRPRGTGYWYAYRSSGRRTAKRYLGLSNNVTILHLEEVASTLTHANPGIKATGEKPGEVPPPAPSSTLLLPKLLPPRLPSSLVARPHLMQHLDVVLQRKLTLLVAPAGFGKTTVVVQWLNERRTQGRSMPIAWVSLDNGDNDLFRFWRSIIAAFQAFQKNLGQTALTFFAEASRPPFVSPSMETALTFLLNDIAQHVQNGLLVLDDYQAIKEPIAHETLTFFLEHLPPTLSVLIMTKAEPLHLPLLRWHARGDLSALYTADLRFSLEETAAFVRQAFSAPLSDAALKQLDTALQGWVAGLRLLALSGHRHMTARAVEHTPDFISQHTDATTSYQPLLDYFVTEILHAQSERLQQFLLKTSVPGRLNGSLCDAVTGEEGSEAQLKAIAQAGMFLESLDDEGGWYRYHTLFSEALYREATFRLGEQTLHGLSLRASYWYEQHAMTTEAIESALLAHDFERAARLIERIGADGQISELYTVRRWLEPIPETVLRIHPMLCWLAALALQVLQEETPMSTEMSQRIEVLLHMAEAGWRTSGDLALLGLIATFHAMSAWRSGLIPRAVEYAQQALAQLLGKEQDYGILIWRGICLFIVGTGFMYEGRFGEAQLSFKEAYTCSLTYSDRHFTRGLLVLAGACNYAVGELHQAHEYYQQALSEARRQDDREITAQALLCLANIAFEWNELETAEQQTNEALALALEKNVDLRNSAAFQLALLSYARGHITLARQQLAALLAHLQMETTLEATQRLPDVLTWQARLSLEMGNIQNAERILGALDLGEDITTRIFRGRLLLAQGQLHEALLWLESLLPAAQAWQQIHKSLEIQLLLALAHGACEQKHEAHQWLLQALSQARAEGFVRLFLSEGTPLIRLLRQVLPTIQEAELRSFAQTILRAFQHSKGENNPELASSDILLVEPLSPQEQRVLRLLADGHSNAKIAQELVVSVNTVKDHVKHIYNKLGVSNRLQASQAANHLNLC